MTPDKTFIPLSVPTLNGQEWTYIKECLDTNWVSSVGSYVDRFESEVAAFIGAQYCVATCNGTSALHVALLTAGVKPGDEVLVSDLTFIAPVNAIRYAGANPVLIDADPSHAQMDPEKLKAWLQTNAEPSEGGLINRTTGNRIQALIPVHILGHMAPIAELTLIAETYGLTVIEDASESIGATYRDKPAGMFGHMACFSFNGNKTITCGGGGMLVTKRREWADHARHLTTQACENKLEYIHDQVGYNYRLTNLQAALGCAQLEQLPAFLEKKRTIAAAYMDAFKDLHGLKVIPPPEACQSSWWLTTIYVDEKAYGHSSRALLNLLAEQQIQTRPLWQPMHLSPAHHGAAATSCSCAEALYEHCLSLPSSVSLEPGQQNRVIEAICKAARR